MTDEVQVTDPTTRDQSRSRFVRCALWWVRPKIAIPTTILVLLLLGPFAYRAYRLSLIPIASEPFDVAALMADVVPYDQNAKSQFLAATKAVKPKPWDEDFPDVPLWAEASPKLQQWVHEHREAIDLWKQVAQMPDLQVIRPADYDMRNLDPPVWEVQTISQIITLDADRLRHEGFPDQALELLLDHAAACHLIGRRGCLVELLVAITARAAVNDSIVIASADSKLSTEALKSSFRRLMAISTQRPMFSSTLKIEYLMVMNATKLFSFREWAGIKPAIGSGPQESLSPQQYFSGEPHMMRLVTPHLFSRMIEMVDKPRHERTKVGGNPDYSIFEPDPSRTDKPLSASVISKFVDKNQDLAALANSFRQAISAADRHAARWELLLVSMALEIHKREHGHYPDRSEELVPNLLETVPNDPLCDTPTALKYVRDGDSAKLWSVGENLSDEGGQFDRLFNANEPDLGVAFGPQREALLEKLLTVQREKQREKQRIEMETQQEIDRMNAQMVDPLDPASPESEPTESPKNQD